MLQAHQMQNLMRKSVKKVKKGQVVCIIEAMKIMNEITSPYTGVIKSIDVNNKDVIGYDQVLMTIGEVVEKINF